MSGAPLGVMIGVMIGLVISVALLMAFVLYIGGKIIRAFVSIFTSRVIV